METMTYKEYLQYLKSIATTKTELSLIEKQLNEIEKKEQTKKLDKKDDFTKIKIVLDKLEKIASGAHIDLTPLQAQTILDYINNLSNVLKETLESEGE